MQFVVRQWVELKEELELGENNIKKLDPQYKFLKTHPVAT